MQKNYQGKLSLLAACMLLCVSAYAGQVSVRKSVIPAAGLGTRFLPFTKAVPKEMVPLMNKPAIHYIIEEGLTSTINQFIIIINDNKQAIIDYFSSAPELESMLSEKNKLSLLSNLPQVMQAAQFTYVPQPEPHGLGHAVLMAQDAVGDEYFGIFLPDDIILGSSPAMGQLVAVAQEKRASVIAVQEVPRDKVSSYGIIAIKEQLTPTLFEVSHLVEKPCPEDAPSNLAIIGRYVLSPAIFTSLHHIAPGAGGEIQLTDGITHMMQHNSDEHVYALKVEGTRHDIGIPLGWLNAVVDIALRDSKMAAHLDVPRICSTLVK